VTLSSYSNDIAITVLTPGSISIAVDRLVAKGLVSRVESVEDRRVRIVALTRGLEVTLKKVGKRAAALMEES
jgi:DNA-binding MarR family transcriptional regulator